MLQANDKVFGDKCKNSARYLTVDYSCDFPTYSDYGEPTETSTPYSTQLTSQQRATAPGVSTSEPPGAYECSCKITKARCVNGRRKYVKACTGDCTGNTWFAACTPKLKKNIKYEYFDKNTAPTAAFTPTKGNYYTETYKRFQRIGYRNWG